MTSSLSFPFHNGKRRGSVFLVLKVLAISYFSKIVKELNENEMSLTIKRLVMGVKL